MISRRPKSLTSLVSGLIIAASPSLSGCNLAEDNAISDDGVTGGVPQAAPLSPEVNSSSNCIVNRDIRSMRLCGTNDRKLERMLFFSTRNLIYAYVGEERKQLAFYANKSDEILGQIYNAAPENFAQVLQSSSSSMKEYLSEICKKTKSKWSFRKTSPALKYALTILWIEYRLMLITEDNSRFLRSLEGHLDMKCISFISNTKYEDGKLSIKSDRVEGLYENYYVSMNYHPALDYYFNNN